MSQEPILRVRDLVLEFKIPNSQPHLALDRVGLEVFPGEILGLVGESGSGKTVLSYTILGLLPDNACIKSGSVVWKGQELVGLDNGGMRSFRGKQIAMIFQDAQASLNPVLTVSSQLCYLLRLHRGMNRKEANSEGRRLLDMVQLADPDRVLRGYPHELSGGMCQRVMIALALACRPSLLIADEPTSSLDVTIQAEIIELLADLRARLNMAILFISHDLGVTAQLCDRVAVMRAGHIVETAHVEQLFADPGHEYTRRLLNSIPIPDPRRRNLQGKKAAGSRPSLCHVE